MENPAQFSELFTKWLRSDCSPEEAEQFLKTLEDPGNRENALEMISRVLEGEPKVVADDHALKERFERRLATIFEQEQKGRISKLRFIRRLVVAAAVLILLGTGTYCYVNREKAVPEIFKEYSKAAC